jgi:tetratricopeptide (TPR) repeat protein
MCRRFTFALVLAFMLVTPARAADPGFLEKLVERVANSAQQIDPVEFFVKGSLDFALTGGLTALYDIATGKPNIREIDKRLAELEKNAAMESKMRDEIRRVRAEINERVTKDELRQILSGLETELCKIKRRISALEESDQLHRVEINDLKSGTKNATDARYFVRRGDNCTQEKEFERAIANYTVAIRLDARLADAYVGRAYAFSMLKAFEIAFIDYTKAITLDPKCADARRNRGALYLQFGDFNKSIDDESVMLDINSNDVFALTVRGDAWFKLSGYGSASDDYEAALRFKPVDSRLWNSLALSRENLGDLKTAIDPYSHAIDIDPTDPTYRANRGDTYCKLGRYSDAIEDCDIAIKSGQDFLWAWEARGISKYATGKGIEAMPDLTRAKELGSQNPRVYTYRGYLNLDEKKDNWAALSDLDRAVSLGDKQWKTREYRAAANFNLGNYKSAIEDNTFVLKNTGDNNPISDAHAFWWRAKAHEKLGDRAKYRSDIESALSLDSSYQKHLSCGDVLIENKSKSHITFELDYYVDPSGEKQQYILSYKISLAPGESAYWIQDDQQIVARTFGAYVYCDDRRKIYHWDYKSGASLVAAITDEYVP